MDEVILKECVEYFKTTKGFNRVFEKIREKYRSLGTLGGTIVLTNLNEYEKEALTGLFRKNYNKKSAAIKIENFQRAIENTRFSGAHFEIVLKEYFGEELISKKEERNLRSLEKDEYFRDMLGSLEGEKSKLWLSYVMDKKENAYKVILQKYDENKIMLKVNLISVGIALELLSFEKNNVIRIALLASEVTRDPHWFDYAKDGGKLLVYAIVFFLKMPFPENAEEVSEVLYRAGIIKDEVSNYTLCSGLLGYKDNRVHEGWRGFYNNDEPLQPSIWNISKLDIIESPRRKVFVFENPTVFSEVLFRTTTLKPSLVCTFGHFRLASLILLDKLVASGAEIYYSGDFDPEGISMADKLKARFGAKLILWRYSIKDYVSILSKVYLSNARIKKLDNLQSGELIILGEAIKQYSCAAYQELLIDRYVQDINDYL